MPRRKAPTAAEAIVNLASVSDDASNEAGTTATGETLPKQRRTRKPRANADVSPETLAAVHDKVASAAILVGMGLPDQQRPTDSEIDGIFVPLERIGLRHMPDPLKNAGPDQRDAFDALGNAFAYALRAFVFPTLQRLMSRQTPQGFAPPSSAARPRPTNQPVTPIRQTPPPASVDTAVPYATPTTAASDAGAGRIPEGFQPGRPPISPSMRDALSQDKSPADQLNSLHDMLVEQEANAKRNRD